VEAALSFSSPPSVFLSLSLSLSLTRSYYFNKRLKYDSKISGALAISAPLSFPLLLFLSRCQIHFFAPQLPSIGGGSGSFDLVSPCSDLGSFHFLFIFALRICSFSFYLCKFQCGFSSCLSFFLYFLVLYICTDCFGICMGIEFVCHFGSIKESRRFYDVL
jgi:hypothetical protein